MGGGHRRIDATASIEEAEEPKRNLVVAASHLGVVAGEDDVGVALDTLAAIADVDFDIAVDSVESVAASFADGVVSPEGVEVSMMFCSEMEGE